MSFVNELFERLRKSNTQHDVQEALASLNQLQDPNERIRAARDTVELISRYAGELLSRGQYKNAAYQFYSGSQVIMNFLADTGAEKQWLQSAADALAKASEEYIQWEDLTGGAACLSISALLRIQTGDWNVSHHLDAFIKGHDFSGDQTATACLYIPYDLAGAVNPTSPNPSLLQRASGYIESYLLHTKPAVMFSEGIKKSLDVTRQKLMAVVKFPSIRAQFMFDHDIVFGEEFPLTVKIKNMGEGIATGVSASIMIPSNLTTVTGTGSIAIDQLTSGAETQANYSLVCSSGEGLDEITVEIPVNVSYQDVLLNKNSLSLGAASLVIRSEKKGQKLMTQLTPLESTLTANMATIENLASPEAQAVVRGFNMILKNITSTARSNIEEGDFSAAELGITQLEQMKGFVEPFVGFLKSYSDNITAVSESLQQVKKETEALIESLKAIDTILETQ